MEDGTVCDGTELGTMSTVVSVSIGIGACGAVSVETIDVGFSNVYQSTTVQLTFLGQLLVVPLGMSFATIPTCMVDGHLGHCLT
jgi:hypothetical protein